MVWSLSCIESGLQCHHIDRNSASAAKPTSPAIAMKDSIRVINGAPLHALHREELKVHQDLERVLYSLQGTLVVVHSVLFAGIA